MNWLSIGPNPGYSDDPNFRDFSKETADHGDHTPSFIAKPRCFSMCESPDIFYRNLFILCKFKSNNRNFTQIYNFCQMLPKR